MKHSYTKTELEIAIKESLSIAQVCRKLNIKPAEGNYKTLNFLIEEWKLDKSHFTGKAWNIGDRFKPFNKKRDLKDILIENSPQKSTTSLKNRLFKEGLKDKICESCGLDKWLNKDIPLELNHKNGINTDYTFDNLEILCPNCHALTENYRGKNIKPIPSLIKTIKLTNKKCIACDNMVKKESYSFCSKECNNKFKALNIPNPDIILEAFKIYKNFSKVGKYFKVSDNTIRRWCRKYNIIDMI